jgi:CheY-like chemotaxis protein
MTTQNKRVLLVDNNEEDARTFLSMLKNAGYDVTMTWSGLDALELLKKDRFDIVVVSDYVADLYVGDFLKRMDMLPMRPCSLVLRENRTRDAALLRVKSLTEAENSARN